MAQSSIVNFDAVKGNLKDVFAGYENAIPKEYLLMREFKFEDGARVGDEWQYGVELTRPHGFTTAASGQFPELNAPVARQVPKAKLQPYQMYLRERITYDVLSRAETSKQAAQAEIGPTIESMRDSTIFRQEVLGLYGQTGLAVLGTVSGDLASITSVSWAAGMWAGNENMPLSVRDSTGATAVKDVTVKTVDFDNLTIAFNAGDGVGLVAGQTLWFLGGSPTTELVGLKKIITNTGTLYNISATEFGLWKGNVTTLGGSEDLGFKRCIQLEASIRSRGGAGDQMALVNPEVFTTLENTMEAARDFGGENQYSPTKVDRGTMKLTYWSPVGKTEIYPHPLVKRGDYFSLRKDKIMRAGACDPTFDIPGEGGKIFFDLQDYPGKEMRLMANNTWFCKRPASLGLIQNINFGGTVTT